MVMIGGLGLGEYGKLDRGMVKDFEGMNRLY